MARSSTTFKPGCPPGPGRPKGSRDRRPRASLRQILIEALAQEGVSRGRIWTAHELKDLLAIPDLKREQVETIARAKLEFDGEVVEVRPCHREGEAP